MCSYQLIYGKTTDAAFMSKVLGYLKLIVSLGELLIDYVQDHYNLIILAVAVEKSKSQLHNYIRDL